MSFGAKVVERRKGLGMSQEQLARALGATPTTIGRYERDEVKPSIEMAARIADVLDVSMDYLMGRAASTIRDRKMLERLDSILGLDPEDREHILYTIDGLIRAAKLKAL